MEIWIQIHSSSSLKYRGRRWKEKRNKEKSEKKEREIKKRTKKKKREREGEEAHFGPQPSVSRRHGRRVPDRRRGKGWGGGGGRRRWVGRRKRRERGERRLRFIRGMICRCCPGWLDQTASKSYFVSVGGAMAKKLNFRGAVGGSSPWSWGVTRVEAPHPSIKWKNTWYLPKSPWNTCTLFL